MKTAVLSETLKQIITEAARFSDDRAMTPIVGFVELEALTTTLMVRTTDFAATYVGEIAAVTEMEGRILLHTRTFRDLVNKLPEGRVSLSVEGEKLTVRCGSAYSTVQAVIDEFPHPTIAGANFPLDTTEFKRGLVWVLGAAADDDNRPVLQSVLFHVHDGQLTLVAADGYELSIAELGPTAIPDQSYIIPRQFAENLQRLINEDPLDVTLSDDRITFSTQRFTISASLVQGKFPDYEAIVPTSHAAEAVVDHEALKKALGLTSVFARDQFNAVQLEMQDGCLKIIGKNSERGSAEYVLDSAQVSGEPTLVTLNGLYLSRIPKMEDNLVIYAQSATHPVVVFGQLTPSWITIIMPMARY